MRLRFTAKLGSNQIDVLRLVWMADCLAVLVGAGCLVLTWDGTARNDHDPQRVAQRAVDKAFDFSQRAVERSTT
jgi:hypothetical protein